MFSFSGSTKKCGIKEAIHTLPHMTVSCNFLSSYDLTTVCETNPADAIPEHPLFVPVPNMRIILLAPPSRIFSTTQPFYNDS